MDAQWYEGAFTVFQANALFALADGFRVPPEGDEAQFAAPLLDGVAEDHPQLRDAFAEMRDWFQLDQAPAVFRVLGNRPRQALAFWEWWKAVFADRELDRLYKEMIGYAVAISAKSDYGIAFFTRLLRRRGVDDAGLMEVMAVAHFFCGITKFADMLQIETELTDEQIRNVSKQADSPG